MKQFKRVLRGFEGYGAAAGTVEGGGVFAMLCYIAYVT
jgi:hypothetical protein